MLIASVASKNNAIHSCADGDWTKLAQVDSGASFTTSLWIAKENAAAPTFTWSGSVACSAVIGFFGDPYAAVEVSVSTSSNATGTGTPHTSPSINTTQDDILAVYFDQTASTGLLNQPSGWTRDAFLGSSTDGGSVSFGHKSVASSGSATGAISAAHSGAGEWVQFQIELRSLLPSGDVAEISKAEAAAWVEPDDGASFSKVSIGAWIDAPNEASFSKVDVAGWLDYVGVASTSRRRQACVVN
ncbi:hypothetical protein [Novosphingobium sp. KN65.2]|uniref:hypothetical protein n=1 Tax=Novosphingobium sp. KN65.2 TaxID=1478134 RepID=UPI0012E1A531|nr:hypothetical protein [Novosphingobium sp. KN65.2]